MSTVQVQTELSFDELLKAVEQLSLSDLEQLMAQVIALQARRKSPGLPKDETALLLKINQGLPPHIQQRFNELVAKRQAETLSHNQLLLEQDLAVREDRNRQLLEQMSEQVQALNNANRALQDAQRRLLTEREQERKRLARELHDDTVQDLLGLNYQLEGFVSLLENGDVSTLTREVADMRLHVRQLISNIRGICSNLRPPTIDSLGLGAALKSYTDSWQERTGIELELTIGDDLGRLPETIELSIFRIVQEGLSNTWKHSDATHVRVSLTHISPRLLQITIVDNGKGLAADFDLGALSQSGHYGILGISERVALLGGRLSFRNQLGGGLILRAEIPHPRAREKRETII